MRILVTGGAGFIASHVVEACLADGHEVAVVDNLSTGRRENLDPRARFTEADIRDRAALAAVFAAFRPEAVSHHAAQLDIRVSVEQPALDADVNILGTINLLQLAAAHGARRFIFVSSGGVLYGNCEREFPASETAPLGPISPYGFSKQAGEQYLAFFGAQHGLEAVILRYANVYGPRQRGGEAGVVAIFCDALRAGRPATIYGDGGQVRDYVYVGDVVEANRRALTAGTGVYNIGTGVATSVNRLYELLRGIAGGTGEPRYAPARAGELLRSALHSGKAARELDWRARVGLTEGLKKTYDSRREE